jgi:hypothetical protein
MSQAFAECGANMMETEKGFGRLDSVHAQWLTAFSLQPKHLSSYDLEWDIVLVSWADSD